MLSNSLFVQYLADGRTRNKVDYYIIAALDTCPSCLLAHLNATKIYLDAPLASADYCKIVLNMILYLIMVSKDFCSSIFNAASEVHASGEFSKVMFTSPDTATEEMFAEAVDEQIEHQIKLQSDIADRVGCGIKFALSGSALRATCELVSCPTYPNGPESSN